MFDDIEIIEIEDEESGDFYFYEVENNVDELPGIVDLRALLELDFNDF